MAAPTTDDARRRRWESTTGWILTTAALLFLTAYAWPIIDPDLATPWPTVLAWVTVAAWAWFAIDYVARLWLSDHRSRFVRSHPFDLAVIVLPLLRPLRLLRLVTLLSALNRHAGSSLRGRVAVYVVGGTALLMFVAALAVLDAERGRPEGNIDTFGDALWWSFATVTTVGYGDRFPVTTQGRAVAAGLMLTGIALLGVITATFASWLVERVQEVGEESEAVTRRDLQALSAEVAQLRAALTRESAAPGTAAEAPAPGARAVPPADAGSPARDRSP
ncbi:potassium channel family protein [Blastococcus sp. KM273129]|uniref:potassium channel family protein n=1 Tax=Blastococcus sp. KM273129 TaxID=2570315 RepID=UPI001F3D2696|nr:potassium channel family protein [Blastococcus sp. KM273129]MCF6735995.1 potassium channel family protein [Blastococcus sp. KM273129]